MLRKIVALFFLTVASLVMLAFATVPHHHHQKFICFNNAHCSTTAPDDSHDTDPVHTDHGCIKNLFQTQITRTQSLDHSSDDGNVYFTFIFLLPGISSLHFPDSFHAIEPDIFYLEKLHHIAYFSSFSGRAPPFVIA